MSTTSIEQVDERWQPPLSAESVLETARAVAPIIRRLAAEAEEQRRLSRPVVDAMLEAGLYGVSRPRVRGIGGRTTMFKVVEEPRGISSCHLR